MKKFVKNNLKTFWIRVNENAMRYFGGAPKGISPDNLKSAVTKACNDEPLINETYNDMARYYHRRVWYAFRMIQNRQPLFGGK